MRNQFYIFPAKNEHFGMTTVEAIASGAKRLIITEGENDAMALRRIMEIYEKDCILNLCR